MSGNHYNRALRVHELFAESIERLLWKRFQSKHPQSEILSGETLNKINCLAEDADYDKLMDIVG